jgi:hypothetical protein
MPFLLLNNLAVFLMILDVQHIGFYMVCRLRSSNCYCDGIVGISIGIAARFRALVWGPFYSTIFFACINAHFLRSSQISNSQRNKHMLISLGKFGNLCNCEIN